MKSDLPNYLAQCQQGSAFVTRLHHSAEYLACGQKTPAVFFCPSRHHVFRLSICNGYYNSLDMSARMAITASRARTELL